MWRPRRSAQTSRGVRLGKPKLLGVLLVCALLPSLSAGRKDVYEPICDVVYELENAWTQHAGACVDAPEERERWKAEVEVSPYFGAGDNFEYSTPLDVFQPGKLVIRYAANPEAVDHACVTFDTFAGQRPAPSPAFGALGGCGGPCKPAAPPGVHLATWAPVKQPAGDVEVARVLSDQQSVIAIDYTRGEELFTVVYKRVP